MVAIISKLVVKSLTNLVAFVIEEATFTKEVVAWEVAIAVVTFIGNRFRLG